MQIFNVIKTFHFDAGHRIWNHDLFKNINKVKNSYVIQNELEEIRMKCANPHGHTFYVEIHLESNILDEQGMIFDTDVLKVFIKEIEKKLDHSYILHKDDPLLEEFLKLFKGYKINVIDIMPTAEGLAQYIYFFFKERLNNKLPKEIKLKCVVVKISNSITGKYQEE